MRYILKGNGDIVATGAKGFEWLNRWSRENPTLSVQKKKTFCITSSVYRKIGGAVKEMYLKRKNKITFWAFTSPENINHNVFNLIMSDFIENLKKNYGLQNYVGVAERQKRGAIHYHYVFDMPFVDITILSNYLCAVGLRYKVVFEKNSIRLPPCGAVVRSQKGLVKYVCKYMSKGFEDKTKFDARCYFMSRGLVRKDIELSEYEFKSLLNNKKIVGQTYFEHTTINHTTLLTDVYDHFRKERERERVFFDDFIQKKQFEDSLRLQQKTKTLKLDLFGELEQERLNKIREDEYKELNEAILKDNRYRKWKKQHIENKKEPIKKEYIRSEMVVLEVGDTTYKDLYDKKTGEFVRRYQWMREEKRQSFMSKYWQKMDF